jgi:hypothetical protein
MVPVKLRTYAYRGYDSVTSRRKGSTGLTTGGIPDERKTELTVSEQKGVRSKHHNHSAALANSTKGKDSQRLYAVLYIFSGQDIEP